MAPARDAMVDRLRATPHAFVAQEWVRLSQAPTWSTEKQQFEPRVVGLRLYATANGNGYDVMPGGLARVAPESAAEVITMQRGGSSKDVWVLGDGATPWQSLLLPRLGARDIVRGGFYSPSRAVENLFWMGRYVERVDNVGRLLRSVAQRLERERSVASRRRQSADQPIGTRRATDNDRSDRTNSSNEKNLPIEFKRRIGYWRRSAIPRLSTACLPTPAGCFTAPRNCASACPSIIGARCSGWRMPMSRRRKASMPR